MCLLEAPRSMVASGEVDKREVSLSIKSIERKNKKNEKGKNHKKKRDTRRTRM